MNPKVLRRFVVLLFVLTLVVSTFTLLYDSFFSRPPGDFEVERGDMYLSDGDHEAAMALFDEALAVSPNHRGALMGRAVIYMERGQEKQAIAELTRLIEFLRDTLASDDPTGRGALAAAYANRGIAKDRMGRYEVALRDYVEALTVDEEAVSGPGLIDKIVHDPQPSTIRKRARYIYEQLQLPIKERVLTIPELDAKSRTYKP